MCNLLWNRYYWLWSLSQVSERQERKMPLEWILPLWRLYSHILCTILELPVQRKAKQGSTTKSPGQTFCVMWKQNLGWKNNSGFSGASCIVHDDILHISCETVFPNALLTSDLLRLHLTIIQNSFQSRKPSADHSTSHRKECATVFTVWASSLAVQKSDNTLAFSCGQMSY